MDFLRVEEVSHSAEEAMVKTHTQGNSPAEQKSKATITRPYKPEKFDADTPEERPVAFLAERRRQFLSMLKAR